jgi:hypothetical protein
MGKTKKEQKEKKENPKKYIIKRNIRVMMVC